MEHESILVLGGSGLVGSYLLPLLDSEYTSLYVSSHITRPKWGKTIEVNLSSPNLVTKVLEKVEPSVIVNLAAFTDVEGCEKNKEYAVQLNGNLPRTVSNYVKSSRQRGLSCYYLHVSTDYVFDGIGGNYLEESHPNPINWYGKTKLLGETEVIKNLDDDQWCIARISTPFGIHPIRQSFPVYIINKISTGQTVQAITDQYTSPIYTLDLARMFNEIIKRRVRRIIHTACRCRLTRYEQAIIVAELFGLNQKLILKCSSEDMNWLAPRPKDSSMNVNRALTLLKQTPRDYLESLKDFGLEFYDKKDSHKP